MRFCNLTYKISRYDNDGLTLFAGSFLRFSANHNFFYLWKFPYRLCALFHAHKSMHSRIFNHKGINSLLYNFNSFCELIDKWTKANILLDGSLSSWVINQDIRLKVLNFEFKLFQQINERPMYWCAHPKFSQFHGKEKIAHVESVKYFIYLWIVLQFYACFFNSQKKNVHLRSV